MRDLEAHERIYTIFHSDGPITLTEHVLLNDYMRQRELISGLAAENRQLCEVVGCAEYALMTGSGDDKQEALGLIASLYANSETAHS